MNSKTLEIIGRECSCDLECLITLRDARYAWMVRDTTEGWFCSAARDMELYTALQTAVDDYDYRGLDWRI